MKIYSFLDNGVSGSLGVIYPNGDYSWDPTPVRKKCLDYTKTKKFITRIDVTKFKELLTEKLIDVSKELKCGVILGLERPMVNPTRFNATRSALRALEASLIVIEELNIPYQYEDSKAWQAVMLPKGIVGADEQKKASLDVGKRLFPKGTFKTDADSLLAAEYLRKQDNRTL